MFVLGSDAGLDKSTLDSTFTHTSMNTHPHSKKLAINHIRLVLNRITCFRTLLGRSKPISAFQSGKLNYIIVKFNSSLSLFSASAR